MNRIFIALAFVFAASAATADTVKWIGAGLTDNWTNPNNWLGLNRPGPGDFVRFAGDHARTFSDVNENFTIYRLAFEYDTGPGLLIGRNYTVGGTGVLTLSEVRNRTNLAQMITAPIRLGVGPIIRTDVGFTGSLTLGAIHLSEWDLQTDASIGGLNFNGPITSSGPSGITVGGVGITRFNAASSWTGTLIIHSTVEYASGSALGSSGVDVVLGGTLRRTTSGTNGLDFSIGGSGTLDVPTNLTVTHTGKFSSAGGTLVKTGAGTLALTNTVTGLGHVNVAAGRMQIGASTSISGGALTVAPGATLEYTRATEETFTTLAGGGTLLLERGGTVQVGSGASLAGAGRFDGAIEGRNARFTKAGFGSFELRGASTLTGGTTVQAGTLLLNNTSGSATGSGRVTVAGNATLGGDGAAAGVVTLQNLAVLAPSSRSTPGLGLGSLEVGGLQMQPGSVLQLELGANGTSDLLTVNGDAALAGTLALSRLGNITLGDRQSRRIIASTGALGGSFQAISGREQSPTEWFAVVMSAQAVDVVRASAGDASLDGTVDFSDLLTLAQNFGRTSGRTWLTGDFTGDGAADQQDLMLTALNYSTKSPGGFEHDWRAAQAALVPEPSTLLLITAGAGLLALRQRRLQAACA